MGCYDGSPGWAFDTFVVYYLNHHHVRVYVGHFHWNSISNPIVYPEVQVSVPAGQALAAGGPYFRGVDFVVVDRGVIGGGWRQRLSVTPLPPVPVVAPAPDATAAPAAKKPKIEPQPEPQPEPEPVVEPESVVEPEPVIEHAPAAEPEPAVEPAAEPEWTCLVCTLLNPEQHLACSACAEPRGTVPKWTCAWCGTQNPEQHLACGNCGSPRSP